LSEYLGVWPPRERLTVVGSPVRARPGWDGVTRDVVGVAAPEGAVLSVAPDRAEAVRSAVSSWADAPAALPAALGRPHAYVYVGKFRWTFAPTPLPDAGEWIDVADRRLPDWLRPFGGQALVALVDGRYAAGVGLKRHNPAGIELSVGTDEEYR